MFKNKKTFSEILDKKIKIEEETLARKHKQEELTKKEIQQKMIDLIQSQFENARKVIGHRFTMGKIHDTMFRFRFNCQEGYACTLYSLNLDPDGNFEFRDYSFPKNPNSKLRKLRDKNITLNELADNLINWAEIVLEEELAKTYGIK